jgi:ribosomal protein S18 acetylase RimI-like enzyme
MIVLKQPVSQNEISTARALFIEYQQYIGIDLCFQNFNEELANLPGDYAPPSGRLYIAYDDDVPLGCVGLRKLDDTTCEMKRLYVKPSHRGKKLGKLLVETIIVDAKEIGYKRMVLDTLSRMKEAVAMYRKFGFKEIPQYCNDPLEDAIFMELLISSGIWIGL